MYTVDQIPHRPAPAIHMNKQLKKFLDCAYSQEIFDSIPAQVNYLVEKKLIDHATFFSVSTELESSISVRIPIISETI